MEDHSDSLIPSNIGANMCENSLAPLDNGANDCGGHNTPMKSGHEPHCLNENLLIPPPKIGMMFGSEYEVRSYCTKYAGQLGFGIMTRNSRKRRDGKVAHLILSCSKGGNRRRSSKRSPIRNVASKKQNSEAHINVSICKDGGYQIKTVVLKHNHDMQPTKDNVNFDIRVKRTLDLDDQAGLRMNESFRSPVVEVGDCDNMTFCDNSCVQKQRKLIGKDGDGDAVHKYFVRIQEQNKNYFYAIAMDDCFQVRNVSWANARIIAAYKSFGDVVTVDCTYLTNQNEVPLVAFVGVNHHGQSILFGCGLLSCEETESFVWLFRSWLQCMSGVAPKGIITDQCRAMQSAIGMVFPFTKYRWCLWRIMKKLPQKLHAYTRYKSISNHLRSAIYATLNTNEFESYWKKTIEEFGLQNNESIYHSTGQPSVK